MSFHVEIISLVSNREGIDQIYVSPVSEPGKKQIRLSDLSEIAHSQRFTPDGSHIIYLSDIGGNEQFRIWSTKTDRGKPICLTPGENLYRQIPFITDDGLKMIYSAGSLEGTRTMLFTQTIEPEKNPTEVFMLNSLATSLTEAYTVF